MPATISCTPRALFESPTALIVAAASGTFHLFIVNSA